MKNTLLPLWSFQGARELDARENRLEDGLSKLSSNTDVEVDVSI
jgi:hypothetical protein